ncbi:MAG: response regulator [Proteobacteria bacterium]|nr:response regulator [Pseudomonadota bacterium]
MKWWNRLSVRLTVFILFLAIIPLAGFGFTTLRDFQRVRLQSVAQIHKGLANNSAQLIQSSLADIAQVINLVAESTELESADPADKEWLLQLLIKSFPHLSSLTLAEIGGQELVKVGRDTVYNQKDLGKHSDHPEFLKKEDHHSVVGKLHAGSNKLLLLDLYIPLLSPMDRNVTSVLVAEIDMTKLLNFTTGLHVGETGYVYVVNAEGKYLAYPDQSAVLADEDALENPLVQDFVAGRKTLGPNQTYFNRYQIEVLSNARVVAEPKLLVVVDQPIEEAMAVVNLITKRQTLVLFSVLVFALVISVYFAVKIVKPLRLLESGAKLIGAGNLSHRIPVHSSDELGAVTQSFNVMVEDLQTTRSTSDQQNWLKQGITELDSLLRGDKSLEELCTEVVIFMANYLQQQAGLIYTLDTKGRYRYTAGYAVQPGTGSSSTFKIGEGLPGQAAREKRILYLTDIPVEYFSITSGLGNLLPRHLSIVPFVLNNQVEAVMELGTLHGLTELQKLFLEETAGAIAIILASARARRELGEALMQTRQQTEELHRQQEELQASNEEMEEQTQLLMASESKLKEQQEELQAANEELEEKTEYLERNKKNIEEKNQVLEQLGKDLEKKAEDLAIASKYKSEFLANMSHELRTPLNSLLLLSRLLVDNKEGNLLAEQVESAEIIYNSGNDLLSLINEILDLAKIEAGKMELKLAEIPLVELQDGLARNFRKLADEKGLSFEVATREDCPAAITSDRQRIEQVLKNFIANAFKFTNQGGVTVEICQPKATVVFSRPGLTNENTIAIDVRDTGIGIPVDKQKIVFEAFQQLEGGTARKYGGTGLGLSISRELANLLGGEIQLQSEENIGSTFTLFLPKDASTISTPRTSPAPEGTKRERAPGVTALSQPFAGKDDQQSINTVADDRETLGASDKTVLIIEDDIHFATTLLHFCKTKGFKVLIALSGEEGLKFAEEYQPKAIILDINLPGIDGWVVLESLKDNPATRHIPVHFMSADDPVPEAFSKGAIGYLTKPVSQEDLEQALAVLESIIDKDVKDLLLIEDNANQRQAISKLVGDQDVVIQEVSSGKEAMAALRQKHFDCVIMDLGLPDMSGFELLKAIEKDPGVTPPPIIVYTGKELTIDEELELRKYSESIIIKGLRSEERLLDETSLFLHRIVEKMPEEKRLMISLLHGGDQNLRDKNILIVDDDMRNVFALSKVLHDRGIKTIKAENGIKALEILNLRQDIDLVLMDIMMPQMDGYETMRRIRAQSRFAQLPIIALTAKAMQRDKDECIAAGASDYLAKPVEINRLLSLMRVWLYR